ncbi:MAG: TrmJ/YjtD family RNA methyltransferase [Acidobacteriaceae bacterium]
MPGNTDPDRLCIILVSTRNPLNIGAAARAMCNFGFHHLRLVQPYDPAFREARSAVGASSLLTDANIFSTLAEAVADCTLVVGTTAIGHRQLQHPLHVLKDGAPLILQKLAAPPDYPSRVAILFGSEKVGLSNQDLSHCHWLMHIPTGDEQESMNLGQAVAVCLYELVRNTAAPSPAIEIPRASAEEVERLTTVLLDTLQASEYVTTQSVDSKEEDIRRMLRRMQLSSEDAVTWLGMLRQILWKLRAKP